MREHRILSLGAGVQSSTLFLLSVRGLLPRIDAAIFADTQYEPPAVYDHLTWLEGIARESEIPIYRVTKSNIRTDALNSEVRAHKSDGVRWASMPYFVLGPNGESGMIKRQCTTEYKLSPIRRRIRKIAGLQKGEVAGDKVHVEQWIGISADEAGRVRQSQDYWITLRYPLIFDLNPPWRRQDCLAWLAKEYPDHPVPRSACIACPFHSNAEWRSMRDTDPASWKDAVEFDRQIRKCGGMRGDVFLHAARVPLDQAPIDDVDPRQGSLFSCGVCDT